MKKFLIMFQLLWLSLVAPLAADFEADLTSLLQIECTIQPIDCTTRQRLAVETDHYSDYPMIPLKQSTSSNWSGYAAATSLRRPTKGSVTSVSGSWTVPTLTATPNTSYSSIWVGIDGYTSGTVEQIGTEHDWNNGAQENYAWFEMYPNSMYQIVDFPVDINDQISAQVQYVSNNTFKLTITNQTKGVYTVVPSSYTKSKSAARSSAEWIVEAPSSGQGVVLPLADFGSVALTNCTATINGTSGPINGRSRVDDPISMAMQNGTIKAYPSSLSNGGKNFIVTWKHE